MITDHQAITRWIALLDRAEHLHRTADGRDPEARRQVDAALNALAAFEHTLTPTQRRLAAERLWLRDKAEPLPDATQRAAWERCTCRACQIARIVAKYPAIPVPAIPAPVVPAPPPIAVPVVPVLPLAPPEQGVLIPC